MPEESRTLKFNLTELTEAVYDFAYRAGTISAGERILAVEIRGLRARSSPSVSESAAVVPARFGSPGRRPRQP